MVTWLTGHVTQILGADWSRPLQCSYAADRTIRAHVYVLLGFLFKSNALKPVDSKTYPNAKARNDHRTCPHSGTSDEKYIPSRCSCLVGPSIQYNYIYGMRSMRWVFFHRVRAKAVQSYQDFLLLVATVRMLEKWSPKEKKSADESDRFRDFRQNEAVAFTSAKEPE